MAPAKRTTPRKRAAPSEDTPEPASTPAGDPNFRVRDDHTILWRMGTTEYVLSPPGFGAVVALDREMRYGAHDVRMARAAALALPNATTDEQATQLEALKAADDAEIDWVYRWYDALFKSACQNADAFPRDDAPGWINKAAVMQRIVRVLEGPLPPGVG